MRREKIHIVVTFVFVIVDHAAISPSLDTQAIVAKASHASQMTLRELTAGDCSVLLRFHDGLLCRIVRAIETWG